MAMISHVLVPHKDQEARRLYQREYRIKHRSRLLEYDRRRNSAIAGRALPPHGQLCNTAIGMFGEDRDVVSRAAEYMQRGGALSLPLCYEKPAPSARVRNTSYMYGISHSVASALMRVTVCDICGGSLPAHGSGRAIDHCHLSGVVRGVTHANCNRGIGAARDSASILSAMARYLDKHGGRT